ncbi:hypothetical protein ACQR1I_35385 [Bradyrhizobium sp. HKCCYLS2038]|uniref:hypothetical protein n=1 Tax=unclassified Bradyrhizobium TaxID=2631580 RepID=UPI003EBD7204
MSYSLAQCRGLIVPFTGNLRITRNDEGKIFRCDDTSNVTVTFDNDLATGFNCGFIKYNTGNVTLGASPNVTNLLGRTVLFTRYDTGSIMVTQRTEVDAVQRLIEYMVGGDFS